MSPAAPLSRRQALRVGLGAAAVLACSPGPAAAIAGRPRSLALHNTHTGERLEAVYWADGRHVPEVLVQIDWILRDHRTDQAHEIDRRLLDLLVSLRGMLGGSEPFEVISGYRSPTTNARLARTTRGVAPRSLHVDGQAIDVRLRGRPLEALRDAARALRSGGVGYYQRSDFVHVDVGRVRYW